MVPRALLGVMAALLLAAQPARGQAPRTRTLAPPEVEFPESFTTVSSLRELADGRVLVADRRDKTLQLVDFRSGKATRVGREGGGPGEYGIPYMLVALPGDSTALFDAMNGRLLLILPDGTPGPVLRVPESFNPATRGGPRATDPKGRFYYEISRPAQPGGGLFGASKVDVVRMERVSGRADTLATLALPEGRSSSARTMPGGMLLMYTNMPLAPEDVAAYAPDGRVAIVRAKDYHVEWIGLDRRKIAGPPIGYEPVKITEQERKAFLASQTRPGAIVVQGGSGGSGGSGGAAPRSVPRAAGGDPFANQTVEWPAFKPPFLARAAMVADDGRLWVLKTSSSENLIPVYDVIDGRGVLVERVALPPRTRLVAFGKGVVYLARSDNDDLEWLGRYVR